MAAARNSAAPVAYDERLRVPWLWWVVPAFFIATLWLAYLVAAGPGWATLVAAVSGAIVAFCLISYGNAPVRVHDGELVAGRARVPIAAIGAVDHLDETAARRLRGTGADPRAYLLIRPYLPEAVRVDIADPADPTPYWYVATRRPAELARAINAARTPDQRM